MDAKPADHRKSKRDFRYAESQLRNLNTKIDKLLNKLDEKEQDEAKTPEEECVICVNSKATMQTWPCGHRVVCRKCLVRTIQIAVSRRSLPLRCVVCRARVLRLKRSSDPRTASTAVAVCTSDGGRDAAAAAGRSHSLPTKLRRHVTAAVAVRSRSVGTGKTSHVRRTTSGGCGGGSSGGRRHNFSGWADAFATDDDDDDDDDDEDEEDYDVGNGVAGGGRYQMLATSVKYSKLESTADRMRHDNQSKNGLQRILGKFKFWRLLRFKNNKP
ncbi:uncharacterized protein LOC132921532 [Rhopalosiphum padi]|uniref:uncharacterized protein LOC132921532 n=1 Tax=Rhopalosiphum padi TaxID=40932 RepID=UPI00298E604E|nr:uncharacterized protein LOC132921532 [Rhopalosiphum padi]